MTSATRLAGVLSALLVASALFAAPLAKAQQRMTDKDVENMMKNVTQDTKTFRKSFDSAIHKSTIRKTTQEKDAKTLVKQFQDQTAGMAREFQQTKKVDNSLPVVLSSSQKIDKLLASVPLGPQVTTQWNQVKTELGNVANSFHVQMPSN